MPTRDGRRRAFPAGDRFGSLEVRHRGDLDVGRLALDEPHRETGGLGEGRFVGGHRAAPARLDGRGEDIGAERLRRLGQVDGSRGSVRSTTIGPAPPPAPACFTVSLAGSAASAAPDSAAASIVRAIRSALANGRAASWITTMSARPRTLEPDPHRVLPPRAARDDARRLAGGAEIRRRLGRQLGRQDDDDLVDAIGARRTA